MVGSGSMGLGCDANFACQGHTKECHRLDCHHVWGCTAASTMETEYQACDVAARKRAVTAQGFGELASLSGAFPLVGPVLIGCDNNKAALPLCPDRKEGQRVKHIDIIHHFVRGHVASGELKFVYRRSEDNVSDCLTKVTAKNTG
jgi:hypothetical protein